MTAESGLIVNIQRLSTEDGPGIRSTVFFKACSLSCRWCQNPEAISARPEVQWFHARCLGCGTCVASCPDGAITADESGVTIDRERCNGCGACSSRCPANALETVGKRVNVRQLTEDLTKDRAFYEQSGGGVTLSGGEPLAQPDFAANLVGNLRKAGMDTALDTCGMAAPAAIARLLPDVSLVLYDFKLIDPVRHLAFTGQSNELVLENFASVVEAARRRAGKLSVWVRTPLVPGATATAENLSGIGRYLADTALGAVERWELCAFNNLCRDKYRRLGKSWEYSETPLMSGAELDELAEYARASGVDPRIVSVTGAARSSG
jgi:pyruvate formate lyase activating enzyme